MFQSLNYLPEVPGKSPKKISSMVEENCAEEPILEETCLKLHFKTLSKSKKMNKSRCLDTKWWGRWEIPWSSLLWKTLIKKRQERNSWRIAPLKVKRLECISKNSAKSLKVRKVLVILNLVIACVVLLLNFKKPHPGEVLKLVSSKNIPEIFLSLKSSKKFWIPREILTLKNCMHISTVTIIENKSSKKKLRKYSKALITRENNKNFSSKKLLWKNMNRMTWC